MSTKHRPPEFSHGGNSARVAKVQRLRGSGAAGSHGDRRTKRTRDRGSATRAAIRQSQRS
jgi:hypothetical protein